MKKKVADTTPTRQRALENPLLWFNVYGRIIDKEHRKIRPKANIAQIRFAEAVSYCLANGIPCRIIMVKPRKVGISTFVMAVVYWLMRKWKMYAAILADKEDRSDILFNILRFFIENDGFDWNDGCDLVPTADLLKLGAATDASKAQKFTANNPNSTIGETPQILAATEAAHYPKGGVLDGGKAMTNAMNSIARLARTFIFVESTAAGLEGFFPLMWKNAHWPTFYAPAERYFDKYKDGKEEGTGADPNAIGSGFIRVFVAWWEMDEYQETINDLQRDNITRTLTAEELKGIANYGWTHEQIAWRRRTIVENCEGKENIFKRDFPSSPDEPFNFSGSPRFDINGLLYMRQVAKRHSPTYGVLSNVLGPDGKHDPMNGRPSFQPVDQTQSYLRIWEEAKVGCKYIIGTDIADDKDMNPASSDQAEAMRDCHGPFVARAGYSTRTENKIIVWRPRIVARFHAPGGLRWGHTDLCTRLFLLSLYYGGCPIVPEMNNHGLAVARMLMEKHKANLLSTTMLNPETGAEITRFGHRTDEASRKEIIEKLDESFRTAAPVTNELGEVFLNPNSLEIFDEDGLLQCGNFMVDRKGKAQAMSGARDDDVIGIAIANYYLPSAKEFTDKLIERIIPAWDYKIERRGPEQRKTPMGL